MKYLFTFISSLIAITVPLVTQAQRSLIICENPPFCTYQDFLNTINNIINWGVGLTVIVCTIFVFYGGFVIMTSFGSENRMAQGKKSIYAPVIGLLVVLGFYLIYRTLLLIFNIAPGQFNLPVAAP